MDAGNIVSLDVRANKLIYQTQPPQLLEGSLPGEKSALHVYDIESARTVWRSRGWIITAFPPTARRC
ncbi:MAG: hypothetical protein WDN04_07445 [Rhodospirillales bacterium]